jgi:hypothetical protein
VPDVVEICKTEVWLEAEQRPGIVITLSSLPHFIQI